MAGRGGKSRWRRVDGILLLDKPSGMSSNAALQKARWLFGAEKGGHTGSLDPLATGMLPLCFGEATKIAGLLLGSDKAYEAVARLGICTDTLDADGEVLQRRDLPELSPALIESALQPLRGRIEQMPPAYSAIKLEGVPAYRLARAGEAVELKPREVQVHAIELLGIGPDWIRLRVECGSGTYIRSLVRDLGEALGCGAHVLSLRRLWVDPFRDAPMWTLEQLAALDESARLQRMLSMERGLVHLPRLDLDATQAARLTQGQRLPSATPAGDYIGWLGDRAIGRLSVDAQGLIQPARLFMPEAPADTRV